MVDTLSMILAALCIASIYGFFRFRGQDSAVQGRSGERQSLADEELSNRLNLATETIGLWLWETDGERRPHWDMNRPRGLGLATLDTPKACKLFVSYIPTADREVLRNALRAAISARTPQLTHRFPLDVPNGDRRHYQMHAKLFYDAQHALERIVGITHEITQEVTHTEQLRQQAAQERMLSDRMRIAAEAADLWVWERDPHSKKFVWDENRPRGLGLEDQPLSEVRTSLMSMVVPEDVATIDAAVAEAIKQRQPSYSLRYRTRNTSGMIRHRQIDARVLYDAGGEATRLIGVTRDVTNEVQTTLMLQRQAEQERALLDRLSFATEAAGVHCWQVDLPGSEFTWSENAVAELGPEAKGLGLAELTQLHLETLDDDAKQRFTHGSRHIARNGQTFSTFDFRRTGRDGTIRHMRTFHRYFLNPEGQPTHIIGATIDVTHEIDRAEQLKNQARELENAQRRLERAALSSLEGHWELDLTTQKHWVSPSYRALLCYSDEFDLGTAERFREQVHPDDRGALQSMQDANLASDLPFEVELRMRHANGDWRWMLSRGRVERDAADNPLRISGSIRDIHQQKLAEAELRLTRERFERAIRGTNDALWEIDVATRKYWLSPRFMEIVGLSSEEAAAWTVADMDRITHPEDLAAVQNVRERSIFEGIPLDFECRLLARGKRWIWLHVRGAVERDVDGQPLRVAGSMQDVTEAHLAREELIQATEAAQAANQAKSAFLANVSHEIRTPMNGIIGMTGLLLETNLERTQFEYADTVRRSADALLTIINDILDFSKIEAGKLEIEALEMDLRSNVEDVGAMLGFQAAAKHLELIVNVQPELPEIFIGDPQRIRQCLINLVGNAIKFTAQGEIVIEVAAVGRQDGKVLVTFEVRDTGIGIAADTLNSLFQPFVQADSSTTRQFGGTGLGLSIVKRLVEMMGGQVGVASELGKGSTFWMMLPLEEAVVPKNGAIRHIHAAGQRILIVDDNETNRRVLCGQLAHAGYEVEQADSGPAALICMREALQARRPFDVALVDFQMPDMDGAMLGERINSDPQLSQARIVVLTSVDHHGDLHRFAAMGFAGYLTKPVRARELFDCLDRILSREAREWHVQSQPLVTRGALQETATQRCGGRVLLVEDNPVNQKVAQRFLERLGCTVITAGDGSEAVEIYRHDKFDLVFMDLQMPVMDGFTATRHIRDFEEWRPRTPIVALTANAMAGQMERCLAAGMDGFLTKPIEVDRLREAVEKYCSTTRAASAGLDEQTVEKLLNAPPTPKVAAHGIDFDKLRILTEGDMDFARELIAAYSSSAQQTYAEILRHFAQQDRPQLARAAHKLKGASANIFAEPVRALCAQLETEQLDAGELRQRVEALENVIGDTVGALQNFLQQNKPAA